MKIRHSHTDSDVKVDVQMTPMIDVVFQLLIFFVFTFKIVSQEGDFDIMMPPPESAGAPQASTQPFTVRMTTDANGNLAELYYNNKLVGTSSDSTDARFDGLQEAIFNDVKTAGPVQSALEVEIDFDSALRYEYVMDAISHINGRYVGNQLTDMIEKIRFTRHPEDSDQ